MTIPIKKVTSAAAWGLASHVASPLIYGAICGRWGGYHIRKGNNPVDNPELMKKAISVIGTVPWFITGLVLIFGLMGRLPGTHD